jgi:phytoene desaturase
MRVVVVGAGLGGLAAACHLVGRGHEVVVLERDAGPGGRAGRLQLGAYRFDTGPTVLTMPNLLEDVFNAAGADMAEHLRLHPVDPMYRACFADGSELRVRHGREAMSEEIRRVCGPREAAAFGRFCDYLAELYELELGSFIDRNYDSPFDLLRPVAPALRLLRLGGLRKLARRVDGYFGDERLRRLFGFQALYAGLAPYEALAVYCVITYMDTVMGVFFPEGGMAAVGEGLAAAATKAGVQLRYDAPVERILLASGASGPVRGVRLDGGETLAADAVVCNPDLPAAYRLLVPGLPAPRAVTRGRYSPSALVWHAGVRGERPAGAEHHNLHFGAAWEDAFRAVLDDGVRMPDPSLLVTVPTVGDPGLAPAGRHILYVLEPVPNLDGRIDWTQERGRARDELAARVARLGYSGEVEVEHLVDPLDWERQGLERGTPFALAHRFFQSGPFRPGNAHPGAPGLVFVGSGTVPGVGVPMVLLSGRLAAERVEQVGKVAP